jgi:hypothetical protein
MTTSQRSSRPILVALFDLRNGGWDSACRCARLWGPLHTRAEWVYGDRIALAFHPSPDERWREWEASRLVDLFAELCPSQLGARGGGGVILDGRVTYAKAS